MPKEREFNLILCKLMYEMQDSHQLTGPDGNQLVFVPIEVTYDGLEMVFEHTGRLKLIEGFIGLRIGGVFQQECYILKFREHLHPRCLVYQTLPRHPVW